MIRENLKFKGTWRTYQKRVLEHAQDYVQDRKIHIVAAPGSGKTTLGIELISRLNEPVLILTPSITIREQWKARIVDAFLVDKSLEETMISQDIRQPKPITILTYQAIHACMHKYKGTIDQEEGTGEEVDFTNLEIVRMLKSQNIKTLCLDECHHLKSEWVKSLESLKEKYPFTVSIALTATPPYDSNAQAWNRYITMCGQIDEEISVPELVKDGSLCPHQDYIYFNYPTKEEEQIVKAFQEKSKQVALAFLYDETFENVIKTHILFSRVYYAHEMLENPSYLTSILVYLQYKNIEIPSYLYQLMGSKEFPAMNMHWIQILLQNVLYDAKDDFECKEEVRETWIEYLKGRGCIDKNQVILRLNTDIEKMLIKSAGKVNSILTIIHSEWESMSTNLRMLILTDYIRKEQEKVLGTSAFVPNLGVLPFFESIRKEFEGTQLKLAVLTGSIIIIPESAIDALLEQANQGIHFEKIGKISEEEYVKVVANQDSHFLTNIITNLFSKGEFHVLIGTKSLLGEGWDSPCINTLILASYVGSYMLSNQMRGRAIRVFKEEPNKTSNIWHLVCITPTNILKKEQEEKSGESISNSEDWMTMERRMKHFLGLSYEENIITDGIERFSCIQQPFTKKNIQACNAQMLNFSKQRESLYSRWKESLTQAKEHEIVQENTIRNKQVTTAKLSDTLLKSTVTIASGAAIVAASKILGWAPLQYLGITTSVLGSLFLPQLFKMASPYKRLEAIGNNVLSAMIEDKQLTNTGYKVEVESKNESHSICLRGGSEREKELFAKNIVELFAPIENQRYLLHKKNMYYCVPESFANNQNKAQLFQKHLSKTIGNFELTYTRNSEGRKILLKGRTFSYTNQQERITTKKKLKSKYE